MDDIKSFKPLPESVTIKPSKIHGLGLFAKKDIPKGVELGITHFEYKGTHDGLIRTPLGGFINHSYSPNTNILDDRKERVLITIKDIKAGDEMTIDYTPWYNAEALKTYN
jgi:SET domain-containing protein